MVVLAHDLNIHEAEMGEYMFKASLDCIVRPYLKQNKAAQEVKACY